MRTRPTFVELAIVVLATNVLPIVGATHGEVVLHDCTVEAGGSPIGSVRLLRRDPDLVVVQTLLQTVLMKRVVAEIRKKEEANWPEATAGADSARQYVAALEAAQQQLWRRRARATRGPNPPLRLGIEFVATPTNTWVEVGTFEAQGEPPRWTLESWTVLERLLLDPGYIRRNLELILADACKLEPDAVRRLVRDPKARESSGTPPIRPGGS